MSKTRNIIRKVDKQDAYDQQLKKAYSKQIEKYVDQRNQEDKDELTKRHENYRRRQMKTGGADVTDLIKPQKEIVQKPGTYFYGTLEKLGKDFNGDLDKMVRHFTLGQNFKYRPDKEENKIYSTKNGDLLYDCNTKTFYSN